MLETNKDISDVREACLNHIINKLNHSTDVCEHDDYTLCPSMMCEVISCFNIYGLDLVQRIRRYTPPNLNTASMKDYWRDFVNHMIVDIDDYQEIGEA